MDILGYGFIDEVDTIISDQLQHGIITSWDKSECQIYLDESVDMVIDGIIMRCYVGMILIHQQKEVIVVDLD